MSDLDAAIRELVDQATHALDPSVDDTLCAITCVDWITAALFEASERGGPIEAAVRAGFEPIGRAAAEKPAVLIHVLDMIGRLASQIPSSSIRAALAEAADAVHDVAGRASLVALDRRDVEVAWERAKARARPRVLD